MPQFRTIPSIDQLRQRPSIQALEARFGADATIDALRAGAAIVRAAIAGGGAEGTPDAADRIEAIAADQLGRQFQTALVPVINASGVILHTNLGRAPLADAAIERVALVARCYSTLEYDAAAGGRGRRDIHAEGLLCRLTGAEAAVVVNNNAAATLLMLAALAAGREAIVSRGELVEIGGGFRIPEVMAQSGVILREVGTTNKTRAADYAAAITDRTALILRVHPSNFRIDGFTERAGTGDLARIARQFKIPLAEDLGSGHLGGPGPQPLAHVEPSVAETLAAGVDICCFSGDKLLGGPQAGIIVGRRDLIDRTRRHPLMRALRVDKLTYAALEATLTEYVAGRAAATVPVQRMLTMDGSEIRARANVVASALAHTPGWRAELVQGASAVGGGSAPGVELPTWLVAIEKADLSPDALEGKLRALTPPVIARIERDRVLLDLRTVFPSQESQLLELLQRL